MSQGTQMPILMRRSVHGGCCMAVLLLAGLWTAVSAQEAEDDVDNGPAHAVIERMALDLRDPRTYQVPLHLDPVTSIELVARLDGVVATVLVKPGERVTAQEEVVRMDSTIRQLEFDRAQAAFQLAQLENDAASEGQSSDIRAAQLDVARLDLRLAEQRLDETIIRAAFDGTITGVHVIPGQFVRAGDPLLTLADVTGFAVDVPVMRQEVSAGDPLEIRVEDRTVTGRVANIRPLSEKFEPLRDLFVSIATARVTVDAGGEAGLANGQTVYCDLIPRHPVAEVPIVAMLDTDDGRKKVQVIREQYVRDVVVMLLGQHDDEHIFVSGRFGPADELIVRTSEELLDGTRIVPSTAEAGREEGGVRRPGAPSRPTGF